jgi:hypothetical protein
VFKAFLELVFPHSFGGITNQINETMLIIHPVTRVYHPMIQQTMQ